MKRSDINYGIALTFPAVIFFLIFFAYPVLLLIYNSFFEVNLLSRGRTFLGFTNYQEILTSRKFLSVCLQTAKYTALTLGAEFFLGFIAALIFNAIGKKSEILRTIFLFPLMVSPIVAGLLWRFMLIGNFGMLNHLLKYFGILEKTSQIAWLSNPNVVLYAVALPDIWLTTCFVALVLYTGIQNIPFELLEAAKIDGANVIQSFWRITVPFLRPVIATVLIIRGLDAARTFDAIWIMTGGGPINKSEVLSLRIYLTMMRYGRVGEASAMATIFLISLLAFGLIAFYTIWKPGLSK